jgi:hypothetical protein
MPTYNLAPAADALIADLIAERYPDLLEGHATIRAYFAHAAVNKDGVKKGPALKRDGLGIPCRPKVNNAADRLQGKPDASILLDGDEWPEWTEAERAARIDECLYALEASRDDEGALVTDDLGRLKLTLRTPDWSFRGFAEIARRHGQASPEVRAANELADQYGQLLFQFGDEPAAVRFPGAAREAS